MFRTLNIYLKSRVNPNYLICINTTLQTLERFCSKSLGKKNRLGGRFKERWLSGSEYLVYGYRKHGVIAAFCGCQRIRFIAIGESEPVRIIGGVQKVVVSDSK